MSMRSAEKHGSFNPACSWWAGSAGPPLYVIQVSEAFQDDLAARLATLDQLMGTAHVGGIDEAGDSDLRA
ncbi:hypothetical protein [Pseudomonas putida]|uniref:Uncharacterized protein n=1 Tax=Pseudomonas putida TaxID=303 RepID=A0AAW5HMK0_PSEPU|nr:hypothetical protein [Pseudomonas putida]MCO1623076.1 hypothetical protein [Pseudomonas putida]WHH53171.1 hypothetical protein QFA96_19390 [Pseudomonas sp. Ap32]